MSTHLESTPRYRWAAAGDLNAFFGLMLDNAGGMILMATLLVGVYHFPREFVITKMIPGTAVGVLVGDLIYTIMAFRLAKKLGRDVTAMPLGLDTPSIFGSVFLVLGPAFVDATRRGMDPETAARHAWFIGIAMLFAAGLLKMVCAFFSGWIRRCVPRAGLLGSLLAIALVIISFLPLIEISAQPIAGFAALAVILATLTAHWKMPNNLPGALAAVIIGCAVLGLVDLVSFGANRFAGTHWPIVWSEGAWPKTVFRAVLPMPVEAWWLWFQKFGAEAASYLPVAMPLALATIIGGIDCAESAAAAGDDYNTGQIIAAEGIATIAGGLFGGVIQTTPYIGQPAFKAMGGRAAYTLATALFIGGAGVFGYFEWIFLLLPRFVVFPILIFVGLEITAQSFQATPRKHFPALALACVPALAYLAKLAVERVMPPGPDGFASLSPETQHWAQTVTILAGGFILTSLLWSTMLVKLLDGHAKTAAGVLLLCGVFSLFGVIHSPLPEGPIVLPNQAMKQLRDEKRFDATRSQTPYHWAAAYATMALVVLLIGKTGSLPSDRDE